MNSTIQLLRQTEYATFLKNKFSNDISNASDIHSLSRSLSHILEKEFSDEPMSTTLIRSIVAKQSGKAYLDNGTQQDAEEFFRTLETILSQELMMYEDC